LAVGLMALCAGACTADELETTVPDLKWGALPDLPVPVSGAFAGISGGQLIVAGGAHFPTPLFDGGTKEWVDTIYTLKPGDAEWTAEGTLPRPTAYGATVQRGDWVYCVGGGDAERHYADVVTVGWLDQCESRPGRRPGELIMVLMAEPRFAVWPDLQPPLPTTCAFTSAALIDRTVYVAGGQETPTSTEAMANFWSVNVLTANREWQILDPWPGPARILPVAASCGGSFYLFSGCELYPDDEGKAARRYLSDAYRYTPGEGWEKLADMPRPAVAAPTPAPVIDGRYILLLGGDDGANAGRTWELKDKHPGFPRDILAYDTVADAWLTMGELPKSLVTTPTIPMPYGFIIPGGEDRPGHRSPAILRAKPIAQREDGG
ncbi:MAG TPA: hypothetical protein QGH10_18195, partial [Armatimonadota bacterium]|nr:hypothetical protein [Armatimonadota bacterium]